MGIPNIKYPCADGWDSQKYHTNHKGIDIGWLSKYSTNGMTEIFACDDGVVAFEGYYPQVISGKTYRPIGVIIKHEQWDENYDYYSIYWHMSKTIINKGDKVTKGQQIGNKGSTGYSGGVHLHFQIIKVEKGAELPKSEKWASISEDPTDYIEVYDDQIFESRGNYTLKKHCDESDYKSLYEAEVEKNKALQLKIGNAVEVLNG